MAQHRKQNGYVNAFLKALDIVKYAIGGAGIGLIVLALIDLTFAHFAKESWPQWHADTIISQFAAFGAISGATSRFIRLVFLK